MLKRLTLLGFLALLFFTTFSGNEVSAKSFPDLGLGASEINYLNDRGIINGYPDGTFRPKNSITRAEAAVMVGMAKGLDEKKRATSFSDVTIDHYASGFIASAFESGIISGYPDGSYRPNNNVTRGDMAIIISRAFNFSKESNVYYHDVTKVNSRYLFINRISTAGISVGYTNGTFKPNNPISRDEFAIMVARAMNPSYRVEYQNKPLKQYVNTSSSNLNIRKGPGTNHAVVGSVAKGSEVLVHYGHDQTWVYITVGNLAGYVNQSYLSEQKVSVPKPSRIIAIDAGHGGSDPGASGNSVIEKEVNLDVSKRVQKKLENTGVKVVMTRTNDTYISLADRVSIAVNGGADTFVSIHANAFGDPSANGTETFYSTAGTNKRTADSKKLAELIQEKLVTALKTTDRGVKTAGFQVIKNNPLPATLIELAFITNKEDATKLASNAQRENAAEAISQAIIDYYQWKEN